MKIIVLAATFALIPVDTVEYDRVPAISPQQVSLRPEVVTAQPVRMPWVGENEFTPDLQNPQVAEAIAARTEDTAVTNAVEAAVGD